VTLINTLNPINESFKNNLSTLVVYRASLGSDIEKNWIHLLNFTKKLIWQIDTIVKSKHSIIFRKIKKTLRHYEFNGKIKIENG
jgi:hypothetical protein